MPFVNTELVKVTVLCHGGCESARDESWAGVYVQQQAWHAGVHPDCNVLT